MRVGLRRADRLYCLSLWLGLLGPLGRNNYACDDLWGKLSIPALWLATGRFPYSDPFSYTAPGAPWIDHEWLSGVVFYAALALGGDPALSLLKAAMTALMIAGAFWMARLHRVSALWPAGFLLLGLPYFFIGFTATGRPQVFTFCLLPLLLALLERTRLSGRFRLLWAVPLAGAFWANLHGGFVVGLAMVLCYAAGEALRGKAWTPYLLAAAAWAAASLINPYGFGYWRYLAYALALPRAEITEWRAVLVWGLEHWPLKLSAMAAGAAVLLAALRCRDERWPWRELPWPHVLALAACVWQAFRAAKLAPLGILSAAVLVPPLLAWARPGRLDEPEAGRPVLPVFCLAGALLWALGNWWCMRPRLQPWHVQVRDSGYPQRYRQSAMVYPVGAVRFLEGSGGGGNVLTPFDVGEFVYWRLYPRFRVSIDGRLECVYPMDAFRRQVEAVHNGRLDDPAVRSADWVLTRRSPMLYEALKASPLWRTEHEDGEFVLFRRASVPAPARDVRAEGAPGGWSPTSAFFRGSERFRG